MGGVKARGVDGGLEGRGRPSRPSRLLRRRMVCRGLLMSVAMGGCLVADDCVAEVAREMAAAARGLSLRGLAPRSLRREGARRCPQVGGPPMAAEEEVLLSHLGVPTKAQGSVRVLASGWGWA